MKATRLPPGAFTLVELLASIAIVAILATILILVTGRVRESTHAAQCVANLRQLGVAAALYSQDHRLRTLPPQYYGVLVNGGYLPPLTREQMQDRTGVWMCPDDGKDRLANFTSPEQQPSAPDSVSYGYNAQRIGFPPAIWTESKTFLNSIDKPARTLYLCDATTYWVDNGNRNADFRHRNRCNVLFFDYHVSAVMKPADPLDFYKNGKLVLF